MGRGRRRGLETASVSITKTREEIDTILKKWGVDGIQWEDDFENGIVNLRFRWKKDDTRFVVRYRLEIDSEEKLRENAVDGRSNNKKFSEKKYNRLLAERGKKEHKLLAAFLRNTLEAVEQKIVTAEAVFLPWLEDAEGVTVFERIEPVINQLGSAPLHKALKANDD